MDFRLPIFMKHKYSYTTQHICAPQEIEAGEYYELRIEDYIVREMYGGALLQRDEQIILIWIKLKILFKKCTQT